MNRSFWKSHEDRLGFFVIGVLCTLSIGLFLHYNKTLKERSHFSEHQAILDTAYRASIQSYRLAMEGFFANALNTPDTLALFEEGVDSQGSQRDLARGKLYRHLFKAYEGMTRQNLLQLHFHLADGTSYLRFHQPERYGDPLFEARPSVRICNTEKRVVQGMEVGKIRSGFRYVFPLERNGRHLGSVEVSVTFKSIIDALKALDPQREYGYVLSKKLLDTYLFPEQQWLYSPAAIHDEYLAEDANAVLANSPAPLSSTAQSLNALLRARIDVQQAMHAGKQLTVPIDLAGSPYTISLLPLYDTANRLSGYLITYTPDPLVAKFQQEFFVLLLYTVLVLGLIFALIWRLRLHTEALDRERRNLEAMNDAMAEGVYVQDAHGVINRVNPATCHLLGYSEKELLGQVAHDLFHRHGDHPPVPKEECPFFQQVRNGQGYDGEEYFLCKEGRLLLAEVASRPIFQQGEVVGSVTAFRDITERKRIEAALRQSEETGRKLSTAVEQSPASVVITDTQGRIEYVNQKFVQKSGYSVAEVLGQSTSILKSGLMPPEIYQNLWETITAGREWKGELRNRRKDGTFYWEAMSISPIRDQQGRITHFIAIKEDISERMRMEAELRENEMIQRTLIESLPIGLVIIDAENRTIEEVNPQAAVLFGAERAAIVGHRCHHFLCPAEENSCPISDLGHSVDNSDRVMLRADGTSLPVLKTVKPITIKGRTKLLECFVDIRERIRAEDDLREANRQLEAAIIRAEQLARDAETASKTKSQFLANMSHEIRTPMNAIIGMTHLAMHTRENDKRQRFLHTVQQSAESLLGLLNDILDFSKMEAGQLQLSLAPFSARRLLDDVLATMNTPAEEKGLSLTAHLAQDLPDCLVGDDLRLRQILLNLVGNAVKFTAAGSVTITLNLEAMEETGPTVHVHFAVADTGIGIPPEKLSLIFDSFEQADTSYARQYGGTGLGLSICKQLIALMGGKIWVESRPTSGSIFHCVVPLARCEGAAVPDQPDRAAPPELAGLRILVVDDNEVNRDVASMLLEEWHAVTTAGNGLEALQALANAPFDIVLMDVQMPVMDGLKATAIIRTAEQGRLLAMELPGQLRGRLEKNLAGGHLAIVAMTAHAMGGDREMCLHSGMDAYITKPFQPDQLLAVLASLRVTGPLPIEQGGEQATTVSPAAPPPSSPVVATRSAYLGGPSLQDIARHFQQTTQLTPAQIERILAAAQKSIGDNLAKASEAVAHGDFATLAKATHTLKGTLLQCGLTPWAEQAQAIYDGAKGQQKLPFGELLAALSLGLNKVL
jgi:nitrogen fixation negative regulator NifL